MLTLLHPCSIERVHYNDTKCFISGFYEYNDIINNRNGTIILYYYNSDNSNNF